MERREADVHAVFSVGWVERRAVERLEADDGRVFRDDALDILPGAVRNISFAIHGANLTRNITYENVYVGYAMANSPCRSGAEGNTSGMIESFWRRSIIACDWVEPVDMMRVLK